VLVSSHLLAEAAQTVDRVLIVDRGRLVAEGTLDDVTGGGKSLEDVYLDLTGSEAS
jgi:ABC-2 type transport system ATP-binding protein